jgi:CheY-like chemotaxis protein
VDDAAAATAGRLTGGRGRRQEKRPTPDGHGFSPLQGGKKLAIIKGQTTFATETGQRRVEGIHPRKRFTMFPLTHDGSATPSLRILVIDDEADNAASLAMLLQLKGYEVDTAHDGASSEAAVRSRRPDVLFIDLGLPREDGYAVAKRLRPLFAARPLLVALTGHATEADHRRSRDEGFDHHLAKPADPDELLQILSSYVSGLDRCGIGGG